YEVARTDFCKQMGVAYSEMEKMGIMTPIYEVHSHYKMPARYEDVLSVEVTLSKLTPYRAEFQYRIFHQEKLIHTGSTVHVWVDSEQFKPLHLKKNFPKLYELLESTVEKGDETK
ncbi:MAG: thioesterase family protein, partial [Clostridia bacterium]|nr:thioesterase family protein [Clostridia bacterium]